MPKHSNTKEYDAEPVVYCARCYSLNIKYEEAIDSDCCGECGCTDTITSTFEEWDRLYQARYGKKFVEEQSNIRNSPVFKMSITKLKEKVFKNPYWRVIISKLYPKFPGGLGKADSLILLFDKLSKDNKIDDLRYILTEYI